MVFGPTGLLRRRLLLFSRLYELDQLIIAHFSCIIVPFDGEIDGRNDEVGLDILFVSIHVVSQLQQL